MSRTSLPDIVGSFLGRIFPEDVRRRLIELSTVDIDPDSIDGTDFDLCDAMAPYIERFARAYFRLEVEGLDEVPWGKALVVGNHNSGITFLESMGAGAVWYRQRGRYDMVHALAHDSIIDMPVVGPLLSKTGAVRAGHRTAEQAFKLGRKVMVYPGGNLEAFRPYKDRHKVVLGGRKGFIKLALRNQVPIIPAVYIGGHEGFRVLSDGKGIVRALGLKKRLRVDTWPIFLGLPWGLAPGPIFHLPLPTKCVVRFLPPIEVSEYVPEDAENPEVLDLLYHRVHGVMQDALTDLASKRRYPVLG